jgi:hypothetical protein
MTHTKSENLEMHRKRLRTKRDSGQYHCCTPNAHRAAYNDRGGDRTAN